MCVCVWRFIELSDRLKGSPCLSWSPWAWWAVDVVPVIVPVDNYKSRDAYGARGQDQRDEGESGTGRELMERSLTNFMGANKLQQTIGYQFQLAWMEAAQSFMGFNSSQLNWTLIFNNKNARSGAEDLLSGNVVSACKSMMCTLIWRPFHISRCRWVTVTDANQ